MIDSLEPLRFLDHDDDTVFFIDIDDTIITPKSNCFRHNSPGYDLISDLKKDKIENLSQILSKWRLSRKIKLVDDDWVELIENLKKTNKVYALTLMNSGKLGAIDSMEEWRYRELKNLGIVFTENFNETDHRLILKGHNDSRFYKGIFLTGSFTKGQVIEEYLKFHRPSKIVFIDDLQSNIMNVKDVCTVNNIECITYQYRGIENIPYKTIFELNGKNISASEIIEFQKDQLINHSKWIEDEMAINELES